MPAAATDYFQKVGKNTATTLSAPGYTIGDASINVASTTNWPSDTGITFAIDETETVNGETVRKTGTYNVFRGVVSGATQISDLTYVGGDANRNYAAGATTRVYILVSADRDNRLVDGLLVEHNQDGTHSDITADTVTTSGNIQTTAGAVITDTITEDTAAAGVTIDSLKVKDGLVVGGAGTGVANSSLSTTAGEPGGVWKDWTPTWTNLNIAQATLNYAKYTQIGKTIHFRIKITLTNAAISGGVIFTLPATANADYAVDTLIENIGTANFRDTGTALSHGFATLASTTTVALRVIGAGSTYAAPITTSSTVPHTWANTDQILAEGTYEAA